VLAVSIEAMQVIILILAGVLIIGVVWELLMGKDRDDRRRR